MTTFNIASIPQRAEALVKTVDSIIDQVNIVNLYLNNYEFNPYPHSKVNVVYGDNSLGDAGKFMFDDKGYYLTGDDDLIYPENYVEEMIMAIYSFGIVTHHGRSFDSFPISNYYHGANKRHRCLNEVKEIDTVQFGGTGVMGFHTDKFKIDKSIFKHSNMADIWIGIEAHKQGLPITVLPHSDTYITYQPMDETIWHDKHHNCEMETKIANDYYLSL